MAKFGRFEFGKDKPADTYEGDYMELDDKGFIRIFRGKPSGFMNDTLGASPAALVNAIHLDKGQSVREIGEPEARKTKGKSKRKR